MILYGKLVEGKGNWLELCLVLNRILQSGKIHSQHISVREHMLKDLLYSMGCGTVLLYPVCPKGKLERLVECTALRKVILFLIITFLQKKINDNL